MAPPDCYQEQSRKISTEPYLKLKHWEDPELFKPFFSHLKKYHRVPGVSISVIHKAKVSVKFECRLNLKEFPRMVSLDSHTLLSKGYFCLPDASKDWRTAKNPLVGGVPHIKYYCGVKLVNSENEAIGVLAVFDNWAKPTILEDAIEDLKATAKSVMAMIETPYEELFEEKHRMRRNDFKYHRNYSVVDADLAQLSMKLGRATSRGSALTVFEKDGSGNPYSQNHNFHLTKIGHKTELLQANLLSEKQRQSHFCMLYKVGSLRMAADILCRSLAESFSSDFVFILELRSAELYTIQADCFPKGQMKINAEHFEHANKLCKSKRQLDKAERVMTRVLGTHGCSCQVVNYDEDLLVKAFQVDFGVRYDNPEGTALFNHGVILPFYRHPTKLVRKSSQVSDQGTVDVYLGAGGYLVGVFKEKVGQTPFTQEMISRIYDHTSILRKLYIC